MVVLVIDFDLSRSLSLSIYSPIGKTINIEDSDFDNLDKVLANY